MKKLLVIMSLFFVTFAKAQTNDLMAFNTETPKIELNMNKVDLRLVPPMPTRNRGYNETGLGMIVGGAAFTIGGLASSPEWYGYNGENKKFFDNPARAGAIIGGVILLTTGLVITLAH